MTTDKNFLKLQANVVLKEVDNDQSKVLLLFEPAPDTIEQIRSLTLGRRFDSLVIKDFLDNGDEYTQIDDRIHMFVMVESVSSRQQRVLRIGFKVK